MSPSRIGFVLFLAGVSAAAQAHAAGPACKQCIADAKEVLSQIDAAKSNAAKLIGAAEAHCKGQAVGFVFDLVKGVWDAKVYCVSGDTVQAVSVDAAGAATKMEEAKGRDDLLGVAKAMSAEKITLAKVVEAAERRSRGKALAVVAVYEDESASFDCYCAKEDTLIKVFVDGSAKSGRAADAESLPGAGHTFHEQKPKPKPAG